jgi:heterodisulfide reductase subunit B
MRQPDIEKTTGKKIGIPILYLTQLMALAFGVPKEDLRFNKHIVPVEEALSNIGKIPETPQKVTKTKKAVVAAESEVE